VRARALAEKICLRGAIEKPRPRNRTYKPPFILYHAVAS